MPRDTRANQPFVKPARFVARDLTCGYLVHHHVASLCVQSWGGRQSHDVFSGTATLVYDEDRRDHVLTKVEAVPGVREVSLPRQLSC